MHLRAVETPQIFGALLNKTFRSFFLMTRNKTTAFFIYSALTAIVASEASATGDGEGEWRKYSRELNGDVYFFDSSRVKRIKNLHRVWSRVRYKTSVMGASSYQSLLEIDCSERTERILQNTFFSDKHWKNPAMNTDTTEKPKRQIPKGSAMERLSGILCNQ
ncbi:MAG: surface-adhesin E family protein [Anderseniella sp.]